MARDAPRRILVFLKPVSAAALGGSLRADPDPDTRKVGTLARSARAEHTRTLRKVRAALAAVCEEAASDPGHAGLDVLETDRLEADDVPRFDLAGLDLMVSVGGDGTFLRAARYVQDVPMLGVNSAPRTSIGHYCAATADSFERHLRSFLDGSASITELARIRASVDGTPVDEPALNDVLFCHRSPAASTRYLIRVGAERELHTSSGVWIATATGSTAAIRSAGGAAMEPGDSRLQYLVREPYARPGKAAQLLRGFSGDGLDLVSRSADNLLFLDGHERTVAVPRGSRASLRIDPRSLRVVGYGQHSPPRPGRDAYAGESTPG